MGLNREILAQGIISMGDTAGKMVLQNSALKKEEAIKMRLLGKEQEFRMDVLAKEDTLARERQELDNKYRKGLLDYEAGLNNTAAQRDNAFRLSQLGYGSQLRIYELERAAEIELKNTEALHDLNQRLKTTDTAAAAYISSATAPFDTQITSIETQLEQLRSDRESAIKRLNNEQYQEDDTFLTISDQDAEKYMGGKADLTLSEYLVYNEYKARTLMSEKGALSSQVTSIVLNSADAIRDRILAKPEAERSAAEKEVLRTYDMAKTYEEERKSYLERIRNEQVSTQLQDDPAPAQTTTSQSTSTNQTQGGLLQQPSIFNSGILATSDEKLTATGSGVDVSDLGATSQIGSSMVNTGETISSNDKRIESDIRRVAERDESMKDTVQFIEDIKKEVRYLYDGLNEGGFSGLNRKVFNQSIGTLRNRIMDRIERARSQPEIDLLGRALSELNAQ